MSDIPAGAAGDVDAVIAQIGADLRDDGVYLDPRLDSTVSSAELQTITDNVAASDTPVYVVLYPLADGDVFAGSSGDLLTRLHQEYGQPGTYLSTTTRLEATSYSGVELEGRSYDVPGVTDGDMLGNEVLSTVGYEDLPTVGAAAVRTTELLAADPAEASAAYDQARAQWCEENGDYCTDEERGGDAGGSGFDPGGLVTLLVVVVVLGALAWGGLRAWGARAALGTRGRGRGLPAGKPNEPFVLPPSAMARVRDAHDRRLEKDAREELLALGEAVDGTEIGPRHDQGAWQAALDHYDAARTTLARTEDRSRDDDRRGPVVLDVVGALVLARRGRAALTAALRGRTWTPTTGCFLNPLHGAARTQHPVTTAEGDDVGHDVRREVPVCAACRADLGAGRDPDVLDVVHRGEPRHYFETDVEPWASTGYGSLDPDLVTALQRALR